MLKKIARKYYVKLAAQKFISFLPGKIGFRLNEYVVKSLQSHPSDDFFKFRIEKGLKNTLLINEHTNCNFQGNVLEVGTGWHAVDIIVFYLLGAKRIFTVDHHCHLNPDYAKKVAGIMTNTDFLQNIEIADDIAPLLQADRLESLKAAQNCATLDELLALLQVTFIQSKSSIIRDGQIGEKVDLFYSESVIHRIPVNDLTQNIQYIGNHLMAEQGVSFHRTDQKDINAQDHVDNDLDKLAYLKYSDFVYDKIFSCRFNSQNRLREPDFIKILEDAGLKTSYKKSFYEEEDLMKYKNFPFNGRFKGYGLQDMVTTASIIISAKT